MIKNTFRALALSVFDMSEIASFTEFITISEHDQTFRALALSVFDRWQQL